MASELSMKAIGLPYGGGSSCNHITPPADHTNPSSDHTDPAGSPIDLGTAAIHACFPCILPGKSPSIPGTADTNPAISGINLIAGGIIPTNDLIHPIADHTDLIRDLIHLIA